MLTRVNPIVIEAPQRSPEWFDARLGNVTGSRTKDTIFEISDTAKNAAIREILGIRAITKNVRESTEYQELFAMDGVTLYDNIDLEPIEPASRRQYRRECVAERLTRQPTNPEPYVTYDMKWGTINEDLAITKYRMKTNNIVDEAFFMLHPELRAGASPDGLVTDRETGLLGVLEIKCLRSHNHLYEIMRNGAIPEDYLVQCHMEMWIANRDFCDFVGFDPRLPGKLDVFIVRLERDEEYLENVLVPNVKRFLDEVDKEERYFRMMSRVGWKEMQKKQTER